MQRKNLIAIFIVICVTIVTVYSYVIYQNRAKTNAKQKHLTNVSVQLAWLHQAQFAGMYVAVEKGYYRDADLDVSLFPYTENLEIVSELRERKVDFAVSAPTELLPAIDKGAPIKAIAAIYQQSPHALASLRSKKIFGLSDFKGKRLGLKD